MARRRLAAATALFAAAALVLAACANQGGGQNQQQAVQAAAPSLPPGVVLPAGNGQGRCAPGTAIAYLGTIAGAEPALGEPINNATTLAVDQHNKANPNCQVTLSKVDSGGTGSTSLGPTTAVITNQQVLGIVGLPFSGESKAVGAPLEQAGLVHITPSATATTLSTNGWKTFFRALGNDAVQGKADADFLRNQFHPQKVCVIHDDSEYGTGLAQQITQALGPAASCQDQVKTDQKEFGATVGKVTSENPQVVFYAGYYPEGAPLVQQLKDGGVQATFVAPDGVRAPEFVTNSGGRADGSYLSCPCVPQEGFTDFTNAYQQQFGKPPGTYSAEAYDSATILLSGIDKGINTRQGLLDYVRNYDGQGLTKRFKWQPNGELEQTPVWSYKVAGGQITRDKQIG